MKNLVTGNKVKIDKKNRLNVNGGLKKSRISVKGKDNQIQAVDTKCVNSIFVIEGGKNQIIIKDASILRTKFDIRGKNNKIIIFEGTDIKDLTINLWSENSTILISKNVEILGGQISVELGGNVTIGDNCFLNAGFYIRNCTHVDRKLRPNIIIGKNCMLAPGSYLNTSDHHPIYKNGKIINLEKDIILNDNVWIARCTSVLKGSNIPKGCVIGAMSLVSKKLRKENCIYGGVPAKLIKEDIKWEK